RTSSPLPLSTACVARASRPTPRSSALELGHPGNARRIDGMALLEAAVCHDDERLDALARAGGMEAPALRARERGEALVVVTHGGDRKSTSPNCRHQITPYTPSPYTKKR